MQIDEKWCKERIAGLERQRMEMLANANACAGAVELLQDALRRLAEAEPVVAELNSPPANP